RNTAIAAASGDLIAFLDADDRWLPGKISRQLAALGAEPDAGLVFTASRAIDARGAVIDPDLCRGKAIPVGRVDLRDFVIRRYPLITSSAMVRRPCLDAVGGFDTAIAVGEDFDLWARILNQFPQAYVPEPLTDYRMHGDGATANPLRNRLSKVRVLEKLRGDPAFDRLTRDPAFTRHQHRQLPGGGAAARGRGSRRGGGCPVPQGPGPRHPLACPARHPPAAPAPWVAADDRPPGRLHPRRQPPLAAGGGSFPPGRGPGPVRP